MRKHLLYAVLLTLLLPCARGLAQERPVDSSQPAQALPAAERFIAGEIDPSSVRQANWYTEVRERCRQYPMVSVYDFSSGTGWRVKLFSFDGHADGEPLTLEDTLQMNHAFGRTTWKPKAVWVRLDDGQVFIGSIHNNPHGISHIEGNDFSGHLCIHFPRTQAQAEAAGPYAVLHQQSIDAGWRETRMRMGH